MNVSRYNEKTDVYSFGVMLYEVFARSMLLITDAAAQPGMTSIDNECEAKFLTLLMPLCSFRSIS